MCHKCSLVSRSRSVEFVDERFYALDFPWRLRPFQKFSVYRSEGEAGCFPIHSKGESHEAPFVSRCAQRASFG